MELWHWFAGSIPTATNISAAATTSTSAKGPYRQALAALAQAALNEDFTLLHQGDDPEHNSGDGAVRVPHRASGVQVAGVKPQVIQHRHGAAEAGEAVACGTLILRHLPHMSRPLRGSIRRRPATIPR